MRTLLHVLLACVLPLGYSVQAQDPCDCDPQVGSVRPYRLPAKWDTSFSNYHPASKLIKSSTMRRWESKYHTRANGSIVTWNTPRLSNTPEDSLYTLEGYIWFIKAEVDCDYHIQIGPKTKSAMRCVVELTIKQCELQRELLDTLRGRGYAGSLKRGIELRTGIPVTVTGLGFYDWQHGIKTPRDDTPDDSPLWKQEGTAWELHPLRTIRFGN